MEEEIKRRNGWIVFVMFAAIAVTVAAGIGYAFIEITALVQASGIDKAQYDIRMESYRNMLIVYTVFTLSLIYLSIEIGTRMTSKELLFEAYRLKDELSLIHSKNDDLSSVNKALENRIRIKNQEEEKEKRHYGNAEILDKMTGLHNVRHLMDVLPNEINRAKRDKKPLVLALVAINELAAFQREEGEDAANKLIAAVSQEIKRCAKRAGDFSFYLEEGRFVILFSGLSVENTKRFITFVRESILSEEEDTLIDRLGITIATTIAFAEAMPDAENFLDQARALLERSQSEGEMVIFEEIE